MRHGGALEPVGARGVAERVRSTRRSSVSPAGSSSTGASSLGLGSRRRRLRCRVPRVPVATQLPAASARKVTVGDRRRRQGRVRQEDPVLQRRGQDLHRRRTPRTTSPKAEEGVRTPASSSGMEQGYVALYQKCVHLGCRVPWCETSQWFECPCHGSKYNRVGEKQGGPAPAGMDRFPLEVIGRHDRRRHPGPSSRAARSAPTPPARAPKGAPCV